MIGLGNQGMFGEDKRYKIIICDDDETFVDLLSEKIEHDFVQRKIVCLIEKYSDSISVNLLTDTVLFSKELVNKMKQNDENQILIYEAMTNTF